MGAKQDLEKFVRNLRRGTGAAASKANMRLIGERAIQLIVRRTQQGFGVSKTGGNQFKLKQLSQNYIDYRNKNRNKLDPTTKAGTSNLTFSGQMLRSMTVKSVSNSVVTFGPNDRRRKGGLTNAALAEILKVNRPFNNLSAKEILVMVEFIDKILQLEIVNENS